VATCTPVYKPQLRVPGKSVLARASAPSMPPMPPAAPPSVAPAAAPVPEVPVAAATSHTAPQHALELCTDTSELSASQERQRLLEEALHTADRRSTELERENARLRWLVDEAASDGVPTPTHSSVPPTPLPSTPTPRPAGGAAVWPHNSMGYGRDSSMDHGRDSSIGEIDHRLAAASSALWDGARQVAELSVERRELIERCRRAEEAAKAARVSAERLAARLSSALAPERTWERPAAPVHASHVGHTVPVCICSESATRSPRIAASAQSGSGAPTSRETLLTLGRCRFEQRRAAARAEPTSDDARHSLVGTARVNMQL
jgi:hypothetical protein